MLWIKLILNLSDYISFPRPRATDSLQTQTKTWREDQVDISQLTSEEWKVKSQEYILKTELSISYSVRESSNNFQKIYCISTHSSTIQSSFYSWNFAVRKELRTKTRFLPLFCLLSFHSHMLIVVIIIIFGSKF